MNQWRKLTDEDYHSRKELSSSGIKDLLQCPRMYYENHILKASPKKSTPAQIKGSLIHRALLEKDFTGLDDASLMMVDAVFNDPTYQKYFHSGEAECAGFFTVDEEVECRIKPDFLRSADKLIVDLKTTADISRSALRRDVLKYKYHIQAAFYSMGARLIDDKFYDFCLIFVEKEKPYRVQYCDISQSLIKKAYDDIYRAIEVYKHCARDCNFPKVYLEPFTIKDYDELEFA